MLSLERKNLLQQIESRLTLWLRTLRQRSSEDYGLSGTQYSLLRSLVENENCTSTDLAASLGVTPSSVTGLTDRLVKCQLVTRERAITDRRVVLVRVTEKGETLLRKIISRRQELMEEYFAGLSDTDLKELARLLGSKN